MTMQGDELKLLRKTAAMSQAELAIELGIARETVGLMERGAAAIETRTERHIEAAIRVRIDVTFLHESSRWMVAVVGPLGESGQRVHWIVAAKKTKEEALIVADAHQAKYPGSKIKVFEPS